MKSLFMFWKKRKRVRVRSMIFYNGTWDTNSSGFFSSLAEADREYERLMGEWKDEIAGNTFLVELIDYNDYSHDKSTIKKGDKMTDKTLYGFPVVEIDGAKMLYGNWTTEPPTQEGLYWITFKVGGEWIEPTDIRFVLSDGKIKELADDKITVDFPSAFFAFSDWRLLGPLPVPAPPSEGE